MHPGIHNKTPQQGCQMRVLSAVGKNCGFQSLHWHISEVMGDTTMVTINHY